MLLLAALAGPPADARPLFATYCLDCHAGDAPRGGFALDRLLEASDPTSDRAAWEKVWKTVRHEFMPPAKADQPAAADRLALARWVERTVFRADPSRPDPGRVTIRRLNRAEYQATVRDLFGLELDLAGELPPDDTAFGFDNIGDAQTVSPALFDTYLTLAEKVTAAVVVEDGPHPPRLDYRPDRFRPASPDKGGRAERRASVPLKHAGRYRVELEFKVGGWQEFAGDYALTATLGGQEVVGRTVLAVGGEKSHAFAAEVELSAGTHDLAVVTTAVKGSRSLPLAPRMIVTGPLGGAVLEYPAVHNRLFFDGTAPTDPAARRAYARAIVGRLADRAFRRPTDSHTLDRLTDLALSGRSFEAGVAQAVTAVLASPRFFYRAESQPRPDDPASVHPLDEFALASRLSYLLWLSVPDYELAAVAASGRLRADLGAQLRRMLADPKAGRFLEDFSGQWLRSRNVLLAPASWEGQGVIDPLRGTMKRETDLLFEHVVRQDRDLLELLTADYTFVNERLAAYYKLPAVEGEEMRKVSLPPGSGRVGVLGHASFLIGTSNPNRTSPVKRGLFVLENLLGREVPPPPSDAGSLDDASPGKEPKSLREQLAAHRAKASCAACHAHFDPIGLALERFDNTGRRQNADARTELLSGEAIDGAADLARALASRPAVFYRCVTEKFLTYALGRGLEPADAPEVDHIAAKLQADGGKFSTLLAEVTASPAFQTRRGDAGSARDLRTAAKPTPPPPELRKGKILTGRNRRPGDPPPPPKVKP